MQFTRIKLLLPTLARAATPIMSFTFANAAASDAASANLDATTTPGVTGKSRHSPVKKSAAERVHPAGTTTAGKKDSGMSAGYGNGNGMPAGNSGSSEPQAKAGAASTQKAGMNPQEPSHNSEPLEH